MKRIAFFHELPPGGARRAVNEIGRVIKRDDVVDLYIVDNYQNKEEKKYFNNTFFYEFIPKIWPGHNWKIRLYKDTLELIKLYFLHRKISSEIRNKNYDIIFVHASKFTESPFLLRFPNKIKIFYCHDPHYRMIYEKIFNIPKELDPARYLYEKINRYFRKLIDRENIKRADKIISNSKYTKKSLKKTYNKESVVCYLGVDPQLFSPNRRIKKNIDILYIGSNEPVDGRLLLMESLKFLSFKPKIKEILIEKEWICDDYILVDLYRRSKIVVCLAHNEPFGLIPLEAMSCGTPVIAVDEGGYTESVVNRKTGLLTKRDPGILARKIESLLNRPKVAAKLGENARKYILKNWTWEYRAKKIHDILLKLTDK